MEYKIKHLKLNTAHFSSCLSAKSIRAEHHKQVGQIQLEWGHTHGNFFFQPSCLMEQVMEEPHPTGCMAKLCSCSPLPPLAGDSGQFLKYFFIFFKVRKTTALF